MIVYPQVIVKSVAFRLVLGDTCFELLWLRHWLYWDFCESFQWWDTASIEGM